MINEAWNKVYKADFSTTEAVSHHTHWREDPITRKQLNYPGQLQESINEAQKNEKT